jgi:hypothetical protein
MAKVPPHLESVWLEAGLCPYQHCEFGGSSDREGEKAGGI